MSVFTKTTICNLALSHCGIGTTISDIDLDDTNEAIQCRLWYDVCRDALQEMMPWSFAQEEMELTLLQENPNGRWAFMYLYPNNIKRINEIVDPHKPRPDRIEDKIKYEVKRAPDGNGKVIYTNQPDAIIDVNFWITDETQFSDVYAMAQSLFLATYICKPLRVKASIKVDIQNDWATWLSEAQIQHKSEREDGEEADSQFVLGRN